MPTTNESVPLSEIRDLTDENESNGFVLVHLPQQIYDDMLKENENPSCPPQQKKRARSTTKRYKQATKRAKKEFPLDSLSDEKSNERIIKGSWTHEEDDTLRDLVEKHGAKRWSFIAEHLPHRVGKQCRERWLNHLDPTINKGEWSELEDKIIVVMQDRMGNRWARISKCLRGRTPNAVKNHWNSTLQKKADTLRKEYLTCDDPLTTFDAKTRREIERITSDVQRLSSKKKRKTKTKRTAARDLSPPDEDDEYTNDEILDSPPEPLSSLRRRRK